MNQATDEQKKESLTKVFAIAGFLAIIIFAVWLAVQIVSILPNAFSSLASLADSVYNYDRNVGLEVVTEKSVANAGESFTISWTAQRGDGTYAFSYACVEGVSVEIRNKAGEIVAVSCDTVLELANTTSLEIRVQSEKARFVDIPYTITYTQGDKTISKNGTITIANATIPTGGIIATEEDTETEAPVVSKPTTPAVTTPKPQYVQGTPTTVQKIIYAIPVSDPKGTIDLQVTYLGVGTLTGKTFTPKAVLDVDHQNAVQFEVKNIGTKTAEDWSYEVDLPAKISYKGDDQKALKPNERAVITLGFDGLTKSGTEKISVEVVAKNDVKKSNNEFTKTIKLVN